MEFKFGDWSVGTSINPFQAVVQV